MISEDFSRLNNKHAHGKNSLVSKLLNEDYSDIDEGYMGPYPPDKDHIYTLTVYALDCELPLANGFYMNELLHAMEGHVLAKEKLDLVGNTKTKGVNMQHSTWHELIKKNCQSIILAR